MRKLRKLVGFSRDSVGSLSAECCRPLYKWSVLESENTNTKARGEGGWHVHVHKHTHTQNQCFTFHEGKTKETQPIKSLCLRSDQALSYSAVVSLFPPTPGALRVLWTGCWGSGQGRQILRRLVPYPAQPTRVTSFDGFLWHKVFTITKLAPNYLSKGKTKNLYTCLRDLLFYPVAPRSWCPFSCPGIVLESITYQIWVLSSIRELAIRTIHAYFPFWRYMENLFYGSFSTIFFSLTNIVAFKCMKLTGGHLKLWK